MNITKHPEQRIPPTYDVMGLTRDEYHSLIYGLIQFEKEYLDRSTRTGGKLTPHEQLLLEGVINLRIRLQERS